MTLQRSPETDMKLDGLLAALGERGFKSPDVDPAENRDALASALVDAAVDAVLASLPPAEPQEGEPTRLCGRCKSSVGTALNALRLKRCAECGETTIPLEDRTISVPVQSSPDPVRAAAEEVLDRAFPDPERLSFAGFLIAAEPMDRLRAALGSVREPGPNVTEEER